VNTRAPEYKEADRQTPQQPVISTTRARQGVTGHNVRYVLGFGIGAVIVAFVILYVVYVWPLAYNPGRPRDGSQILSPRRCQLKSFARIFDGVVSVLAAGFPQSRFVPRPVPTPSAASTTYVQPAASAPVTLPTNPTPHPTFALHHRGFTAQSDRGSCPLMSNYCRPNLAWPRVAAAKKWMLPGAAHCPEEITLTFGFMSVLPVTTKCISLCGVTTRWHDGAERLKASGVVLNFQNKTGVIMPKDTHQKAAEQHEQTAKAHRTAAEQHGSNDHVSAKQQSAQALDKSKTAHEQSTQANTKSQQQK
jgi:hypothetical protein